MRTLLKTLVSPLIMTLFCSQTFAQEEQTKQKEQDVERIEVVNKVPVYRLKALALEAKMDFYDMFNKINDVREYQIICTRVSQPGSNIKRNQCEPYYFKEKRAELKRQFSNNDISRTISVAVSEQQVAAATKEIKAQADEHTIKLIQENPALMERYLEFEKANKAYRERVALEN